MTGGNSLKLRRRIDHEVSDALAEWFTDPVLGRDAITRTIVVEDPSTTIDALEIAVVPCKSTGLVYIRVETPMKEYHEGGNKGPFRLMHLQLGMGFFSGWTGVYFAEPNELITYLGNFFAPRKKVGV